SSAAIVRRISVAKCNITKMFFDNFLNNRKAKASTLVTGCHIGLDYPLALCRQADAVVFQTDFHFVLYPVHAQADLAIFHREVIIRRSLLLDGFDRIFDDVGQRLTQLAAVTDKRNRWTFRIKTKAYIRMSHFLKKDRLFGDIDHVLLAEYRLRHPRKG